MAKLETWNLYDNHPDGDEGRKWASAGYFGSLAGRPTTGVGGQTINLFNSSQYSRLFSNTTPLKPEGEGWIETGKKVLRPASAAYNWGTKAGSYVPAKEEISVPIYSRVAPTPPPPTPAPPTPTPPRVDPADEAAASAKYASAANRARTYLVQGPGSQSSGSTAQAPTSGSSTQAPEDSGWYGFGRPRPGSRDRIPGFFQQAPERTAQQTREVDTYAREGLSAYDAIAQGSRYDTGKFLDRFAKDLVLAPNLDSPSKLLADAEEAIKRLNKAYA